MTERILQLNDEIFGNHRQKRLFYAFIFSLVGVVIIYTYLVGSIIFSAVVRKDIEISTRNLEEKIGVMEVKYLDRVSKITPELARSLGFKEATAQVFTPRITSGRGLTFRGNEN